MIPALASPAPTRAGGKPSARSWRARSTPRLRTPKGCKLPTARRTCARHFGARGIEVVPRADGVRSRVALRLGDDALRASRRHAMRSPPQPPSPRGHASPTAVAEFDEWYENTREGLEQGFTVHAPPPGDGPLCIAGQLGGGLRAELSSEDGAVDLLRRARRPRAPLRRAPRVGRAR